MRDHSRRDALVQAVAIFKTAEESVRKGRRSQSEEHVNGSIGRHNGKALH